MKKKVATVIILVLVILSGCNSFSNEKTQLSDTQIQNNTKTNVQTSGQTVEKNESQDEGPDSTQTRAKTEAIDSFTQKGQRLPVIEVFEKTLDGLKSVGSFQYTENTTYYYKNGTEKRSEEVTILANLTKDRIYRVTDKKDSVIREYREKTDYYTKFSHNDRVEYYYNELETVEGQTEMLSQSEVTSMDVLERELIINTNFSIEGVKKYNNETVTIYRATGDKVFNRRLSLGPSSEVINSSVTMYIDNEGLLHYVKITAKYNNSEVPNSKKYSDVTSYEYTQKLSSFGDISIDKPNWLDDAKENS